MSDAPVVQQVPARTCIKRTSGLAIRSRKEFRSPPSTRVIRRVSQVGNRPCPQERTSCGSVTADASGRLTFAASGIGHDEALAFEPLDEGRHMATVGRFDRHFHTR